ncbi:MAG: methyltransferase domain-containing protein [Actinobacteria bacterium]|nr:methyltransferase domain-containing protein [Actinomycetota bacterium]
MSFAVGADAYGAFMGRFSEPLALRFADVAGVTGPAVTSALDVGCGTGALTRVLVDRLGPDRVCAVDPSPPFVAAMHERFPDVDVRAGRAEALPFDDGAFDAVLAQLVVHFMTDPVAGLAEMVRTARPGGVVAACVWDHAGGTGPLAAFWAAVREGDPDAPDESELPGAREGHLVELLTAAGATDVTGTAIAVEVPHASFDAWWEPFTLGVGPAGAYVAALDGTARRDLRERCRARLPQGPSSTTARAWVGRGLAPR